MEPLLHGTFKGHKYSQYDTANFKSYCIIFSLPPPLLSVLIFTKCPVSSTIDVFIQRGSMAQLLGFCEAYHPSVKILHFQLATDEYRPGMWGKWCLCSLIRGRRSSVLGLLSSCSVCNSCSVHSGPAQPSSLHLSLPSIPARATKEVLYSNTRMQRFIHHRH